MPVVGLYASFCSVGSMLRTVNQSVKDNLGELSFWFDPVIFFFFFFFAERLRVLAIPIEICKRCRNT